MKSEAQQGSTSQTIDGFECVQCGRCCKGSNGTLIACEEDFERWEKAGRKDILGAVDLGYDLWFNPETGEEFARCPWLRKKPNQDKYICTIHSLKPRICKDYPSDRKHGKEFRCKGMQALCRKEKRTKNRKLSS